MHSTGNAESQAIRKLIAQIDDIDRWRERVGRRIIGLFLAVFLFAVGLLFYVVQYAHPPQNVRHPGPRVPGVLKSWKQQTAVSPSPVSQRQ